MINEFIAAVLSQVQAPGMADPRAALLAKMHDVIAPTPIGVWPPAIGWWVLFLLILSICTITIYLLVNFIRNRKYRRFALNEISLIESNSGYSEQEKILRTLHVLKRAVFTAYPNARTTLAGIYGAQWIKQLNACAGKTIFDEQIESSVEAQLYAPTPHAFDTAKFITASKRWVRQHKANNQAPLMVQKNSEEAHV